MWWVFVPLIIGLVIALVAGPFSGDVAVDPETGETISTPGQNVLNIITEPKVLGLILILMISSCDQCATVQANPRSTPHSD